MTEAACAIGIIMGSQSDWETMQHTAQALDRLGVAYETRIMSAHRTPERLFEYARGAQARGLKAIIAGAGGAAHLPGVAAALTPLPVLGVPIESQALRGLDSLLSIVQMPAGVPVASDARGRAGRYLRDRPCRCGQCRALRRRDPRSHRSRQGRRGRRVAARAGRRHPRPAADVMSPISATGEPDGTDSAGYRPRSPGARAARSGGANRRAGAR